MVRPIAATVLAICLASDPGSSAAGAAPVTAREVLLDNVHVIPMTGPDVLLRSQSVLIHDGRIAAIGPAGTVTAPRGTRRVKGSGRYLVPGLVDAHVHFQEDAALNRAMTRLFVANGVTTVMNLFGSPAHLRLREAIANGAEPGPRLFTSGPSLGDPVGRPPTTPPEEIEARVRDQARAGYDFIKLHGDLTREAYHAMMSASRDAGIRVIGHAPRNLGVEPMIEERQPAIAHVEEYLYAALYYERPPDRPIPNLAATIDRVAAGTASAGSAVITTLAVYRGIPDQIEDLDGVLARPEVGCLPRGIGAAWNWWPPSNTYVQRFGRNTVTWFHNAYDMLARLTLAFQRAGVLLLAGTDTPTATVVPGFSLGDELRALVRAGLTPYQALQAATVNPARFLHVEGESGTLEAGQRADAVLLDGNPLEDIGYVTGIRGVLLNGRWLDRPALDRMLREVTPQCGR